MLLVLQNNLAATAINGTLSATIAAVTQSATGQLLVKGQLAATIDPITQSTNGDLLVQGSLASTIAAVTQSATGAVIISASAAQTIAPVTLAASGAVIIQGSASQTIAPVTQAATGALLVQGTFGQTIDPVTLTANGAAGGTVNGTLGVTIDAITLAATGELVTLRTDRGGDGGSSPVRNRRKHRYETRDQLQKLLETQEEEPEFTPEQVTAIKEEIVQSIEAGGLLGPVKAPVAEFVQREVQLAFVPGMDWAAIRQTVAFITARAAEEAERIETEIEEEDIMLLLLAA